MKERTIGIFYDGVSSVPQEIELIFDKEKKGFAFKTANNKLHFWKLNDIVFGKKGSVLNLEHGEEILQNIKVKNIDFISSVNVFRKKNGYIDWYQRLIDLGLKSHVILAVFILIFIVLGYIFVIPWVAEKSVVLIPEDYDNKLGDTFYEQNMTFSSIDSSKTKALNLFAKELKLNNTKKLKFTVVNSSEVNAFALPDGNIVVFTGIIDSMTGYDELVGLIGHEASHVNNRHSMKMLCRNLSGYLFVSTVLGDANGVMAVLGDNVNMIQSLSFSREFERQADLDGFEIMTLNKINPEGMSTLFKRLQGEKNFSIPEFLSSHPVTTERIGYIDEMIKTKSFVFKENPRLKKLFKEIKY
ncbi:M48 family metallopeptidase [Flavobacterium sp. LS1R47]|uniref:M48 family metallopeptidase n=1 Tax=Flavobacterium frigoritolerans TaxID=2987686 RepID=A0A9X2ZR65_9FLAO|nr:M48 family metallopeptidase [Flavobacterium frigoritolerans]MCV9932453.1 M48 family metallopeptidase [Flavobacterium frigoritolerans]